MPPPIRLLAQADLLLLLRDLLAPPQRSWDAWTALNEPVWCELLEQAGLNVPVAPPVAVPTSMDQAAFRAQHSSLFEGAELCPLNEASYIRRDKGAILADICGFYRAFGFEPSGAAGERPDHLTAELEFTAILLVLLARAHEGGEAEHAEVAADALAKFARDHLGEWLPLVARRLADPGVDSCFGPLGTLLDETWRGISGAHGWPVSAESTMSELPGTEQGTPYECGMVPEPTELTVHGRSRES